MKDLAAYCIYDWRCRPAAWYKDRWDKGWPQTAPRPPSYNVSKQVLSKHHPTISCRDHFGEDTQTCIDADFKNRWRTLILRTIYLRHATAPPPHHFNIDCTVMCETVLTGM